MKIEQIYTGCLAQGAYYIESEGEAAFIDPLRETKPYLERVARDGVRVKYVFETHFHADFVSGHLDLAKQTGATIVFGPGAVTAFETHTAQDGEIFKIGKVCIKVLHTPGHTPESSCYLLIDENGRDHAIFTGDTLFIGDVGRPDLAIKGDLTERDLAGMLYDSLQSKIIPLADEVIVYPAHGAGSACGKNMSKETVSTIGLQKELNYALKATSRDQFIYEVTDGLSKPPQYFAKNALMNKMGYESIETVMARGAQALSPAALEEAVNAESALILDVRNQQSFAKGFIPNSIFIGLDGQFAPWVGALITDLKQAIVLVAPEGREEEAVLRLARVGYDNCIGYLKGGFEAWKEAGKEVDSIESITVDEFSQRFEKQPTMAVLDARRDGEYASEHLENAEHFALDYINENMQLLDRNEKYHIHCAGGYRSMIMASILRARGFENLVDIQGGFAAIQKSGKFKTTDFVCPSKLKRGEQLVAKVN
jgi:glyoxylase-like metal-dependent hydrolase (beta-lactamase superfamily II)/rhodanese-related sulfurtransferase